MSNVIYEATINSNLRNYKKKIYIGLSENTFKKRFNSHKTSFRLEKYKNSTALSTEYWRIKELNGQPIVTWRILRQTTPYNPESGKCQLCLHKKFEIANYPNQNILNKRSEIVSKCRHRRKFLLINHLYDTGDWRQRLKTLYCNVVNGFYFAEDCRPCHGMKL